MSSLDISEWKAFLMKPAIQQNFNDRRDDERNYKCFENSFLCGKKQISSIIGKVADSLGYASGVHNILTAR